MHLSMRCSDRVVFESVNEPRFYRERVFVPPRSLMLDAAPAAAQTLEATSEA